MNTIDLSPLYRNSIGFDRFGALLDSALHSGPTNTNYPPYDIEAIDEDHYKITLAVAGFDQQDLDIQIENGLLKVNGKKSKVASDSKYLYQGISNRAFERKFNIADYVNVTNAELCNGLLHISLVREIPEAMKPKNIAINASSNALEHNADKGGVENKIQTKEQSEGSK